MSKALESRLAMMERALPPVPEPEPSPEEWLTIFEGELAKYTTEPGLADGIEQYRQVLTAWRAEVGKDPPGKVWFSLEGFPKSLVDAWMVAVEPLKAIERRRTDEEQNKRMDKGK
jgi:hypothetical protein